MPSPFTYSFLDVKAALVGPGGSFNIGSDAANSDEGISIEPVGEIDAMMIGADGQGMHSLLANKAAKITVRLLKTSPVNSQLSAMLAFQRTASVNHGVNTLTVVNTASGDVHTCQQTGFAKVPSIKYAKEGDVVEWEFNSINHDMSLGAGVQA